MIDAAYDHLASKQADFWWSASRDRLIRLFMRRVSLPENAVALDVGCGTGGSLSLLSEFATRVVGFDTHPRAIELARRLHPTAELSLGDANTLGERFSNATFDLVAVLGVLYHEWIADDASVLTQVGRVLKPGGIALVTEPAFACLARQHDRVVMGQRRYTLGQMRALLERAGFTWVAGTYFNMFSFLPAWLMSRRDHLRADANLPVPSAEAALPPWPINEGMKCIEAVERLLVRVWGRLPFGVELLVLARMPAVRGTQARNCQAP